MRQKKGEILYRCECGGYFWKNSPRHIQERHMGLSHKYRVATHGPWWVWLKMKLGMIR